jgi:hypothetical protein
MKKLMLGIVALATLPLSTLLAQSIVGTWQGALTVSGTQYRAVFKITTTDADGLKAVMYPSIDQSVLPLFVDLSHAPHAACGARQSHPRRGSNRMSLGSMPAASHHF